MVFGVKVGIEGSKRHRAVGIVMYHSANYCDSMSVVTPYSTRSGLFFSNMDAYSPNYAVPTLSTYREEYDLVKMNMRRNSWLANSPWHNEVKFWLDWYSRYVETTVTRYVVSIKVDHRGISIAQSLDDNDTTLPTPTSLAF
jgi:hypothetical protein